MMPNWVRTLGVMLALLIGPQPGKAMFARAGESRAQSPSPAANESPTTKPRARQHMPVSFRHEVMPLLTRAGCNAGTCHGTPTGKNGFRLSLRGYDPAADYVSLSREVSARRVDPLLPERSLILLKATATVPHEGGRRFLTGSAEYESLRAWIAAGVADDSASAPEIVELQLAPPHKIVEAPATSLPVRAMARFADGTLRDVTHLCRFSVNDESVGTVDAAGVLHKQQRGAVTVSAEYCNAFATADVIFREPVPGFAWTDPPVTNAIDRLVFARLKLLQLEPSELTTDVEFLRRVTLDVTGRLPAPDDVRSFASDARSDKREKLIETLLDGPEFADWWALKWSDRLGCNQRFVGKWGAMKYHNWIRQAMASNMPEDEFVRALLTASGPNYSVPEAGFWRRLRVGGIGKNVDPLLAAEEISQLFLGVRIQCARCHNHPGEHWTQEDYFGLAAFFPQVKFEQGPYFNHTYDQENTVYTVEDEEVRHPRTGQAVVPHLLGAGPARMPAGVTDRRAVFAEWATSPKNPFFARAAVNRIWFHLFGRGLVEPVDDFRSSNPASHPEVLAWLTEEFVAHDFDRKHIIRMIVNSRTYQLSSRTTPTNAQDEQYFSHGTIRLLQAEQLLDAISQASGVPERFPEFPPETGAIALPDGEYKHPFLDAFGRPARALACECERETGTNFTQALQLISGQVVHRKLAHDAGRAAQLAASDKDPAHVIDELFLATLNRFPTEDEAKLLAGKFASAANRRAACEDLLWTLLNHREFLFQH